MLVGRRRDACAATLVIQNVFVASILRHRRFRTLTVIDDGHGIPQEHREKVFDRFYRVETDRGRATGGFGLGLAISRRAVENQGGRLDLAAGTRGGARFEIRLPLPPRAGLA